MGGSLASNMISESSVQKSVCEFTSKLYQVLVELQDDCLANTFVAPLSVYATMAMTLSGTGGKTKSEMLAALQMPIEFGSSGAHQKIGSTLANYFKSSEGVTVNLANALFANNSEALKQQFKDNLKAHYGAQAESLPFGTDSEGSRKHINAWVSQQTKDKIKEILAAGTIGADTYMVLVNALYFRGSWFKQFPKENTADGNFYKLDGSKISVKTMFLRADIASANLSNMDATIVRLPFRESNWEMVVVLPDARDGLKQLMKKMSEPSTLPTILSTACYTSKTELFLPRFKLGDVEAMDVVKVLKRMGIQELFEWGKADFSGMSDSKNLYVSAVLHKAILEVDEEGATAAAATAGAIACMCAPIYAEIRVDHPFFVALVYDKTVPVFLGHVTEPESF